ncbi:hypothetical protein VKT23_017592 [Stygiomarasmius scandens]|uniref:Uncharacterized protein n=1 Tax=Marasmiellus scandens TaxID=2682957 RepID=A0ABR1IRL2_9AGAR
MISTARFAILGLSLLVHVHARPTENLSTQDLLANGQQAQQLNAAFQNLTVDDACSTGDRACISGDLAECVDDKWQTSSCPGTQQCFALPSVKKEGVINISCTSERSALSLISATGATGGIAVASNDTQSGNNTGVNSDDSDNDNGKDNDSNNDNGTQQSSSADSDSGVTTVTATATATVTVFAETHTLSPEEASSFFDSLTRGAVTTIISGAQATASVSGNSETTISSETASRSVIHLTAAAVSAAGETGTAPAATATQANSSESGVAAFASTSTSVSGTDIAVSATSTPDTEGSYGGYGY